ncbi:MAG TPA: M23 family metallopeptidase [Thermoanaerobaculia bacterium]|nr:M23 family metallopeptidase [Thermoanaerobaculia bacterium]
MRFGRIGRSGPAPAATAPPDGWTLEVQIHPSDIRKRVRYLFLSRLQMTLWSLLALLYLTGLALGLGVAPSVLRRLWGDDEYPSLIAERSRQGERLQALVQRLDEVEEEAGELYLHTSKIALAYGVVPAGLTPGGAPGAAGGPPAEADSIYAAALSRGDLLQSRIERQLSAVDGSLEKVRELERSRPEKARTTPAACPLRGDFVLVSPFGRRRNPLTREFELHAGLDLAAPLGSPIYATADGVVTFAGRYPSSRSPHWWRLGNLVAVQNGEEFITLYGHCQEIEVEPGQRVRRGDRLGTVGRAELVNTTHLHYEIRRRTAEGELRPVGPLMYILDRRWPNEERLLRADTPAGGFEPVPEGIAR